MIFKIVSQVFGILAQQKKNFIRHWLSKREIDLALAKEKGNDSTLAK